MARRPFHSTPFAGATFALGFTAMLGAAGAVVSIRTTEESWAPLLFPLLGVAVALLLQWSDLALLRFQGRVRPLAWRRRWRLVWFAAPLLGVLVGVITGALYELPG